MDGNHVLTVGAVGGALLLATNGLMTAILLLIPFGILVLREYLQGPDFNGDEKLDGKIVVITGGNAGIGKETAVNLSQRGAKIILGCRDVKKAKKVADTIEARTGNVVRVIKLDLNSFASVREFARQIRETEPKIDILINNAGVFEVEAKSEDGNEVNFQTNHLSHFLLTILILPTLTRSKATRIINLSSSAHAYAPCIRFDDVNFTSNFISNKAYAQSKLANVLFTKELARRLEGTRITVYAVHPGFVKTKMANDIIVKTLPSFLQKPFEFITNIFARTSVKGCQTSVFCAVAKSIENDTGKYYHNCAECQPSAASCDVDAQKRLWELSEEMTGVKFDTAVLNVKNEVKDEPKVVEEVEIQPQVAKEMLAKPEELAPEVVKNDDETFTKKSASPTSSSSSSSSDEDEVTKEDETGDFKSYIKTFDKDQLKSVETKEESELPKAADIAEEKEAIEAEVSKNKDLFGHVTDQLVESGEPQASLHHAETKVNDQLPDKYDILVEKAGAQLMEDVAAFEASTLKPVKPIESDPMTTIVQHDILTKDIENFDSTSLKHTDTVEDVTLPSKEEIEQERALIEENTEANKEVFTREVVENLGAFDTSTLKHVEQEVTDELPDSLKEAYVQEKTHEQLLKDISGFEEDKLVHVKTVEPVSGLDLAKSEITRSTTLEEVSTFDKSSLKTTVTEEKVQLPNSEDINIEKQILSHEAVINEVTTFETSTLRASEIEEKSTLPTADDIRTERLHRELITNIDEFDPLSLSKTKTEEKQTLPNAESILQEKRLAEAAREEVVKEVVEDEADRQRTSSGESSNGSHKTKSSSSDSWEKVES